MSWCSKNKVLYLVFILSMLWTGSNARAQFPMVDNDGGATNIGVGEAALRGTLDSFVGANVTIYWGDNDGGTNRADWDSSVPLGFISDGVFTSVVSGLYYGLGYHYRTYATNFIGDGWANSSTNFKTSSPFSAQ